MLSIVVARYNEDLEWLNSVKEHVYLYNKGETLPSEGYASYKELPNVGREAHTYLQYIIDNYDNLPTIVCFTQGQVADHYNFTEKSQCVDHLINLMNSAVLSETGFSINFSKGVINEHCGPNFNIDRGEKHNDCYFKDSEFLNNGIIESFKDWFESRLRIQYPEKLIHSWNGIFAVRGENIKKRSLNFYKNILKEVDKVNRPVEAHFFERAWYYVFQEPDSDLDAIFICHKNALATYKSLESFRKYNPWSKIYLISDNGYDYSEMAKHFNCDYTHLDESINALYILYKDLDYTTMREKYNKFWELYLSVFESSGAKFIMKMEDDVIVQHRIITNDFNGIINGPTLYKLPDTVFQHYYRNNLGNIIPPKDIFFSGHGGCLFDRVKLVSCLKNKDVVERVIESYRACGIQGGVLVEDLFISIIGTVMGYTIQNNDKQMEVDTERYIKNRDTAIILHQVKDYYNMSLPSELSYLVKEKNT